jgi:hypothetical protein
VSQIYEEVKTELAPLARENQLINWALKTIDDLFHSAISINESNVEFHLEFMKMILKLLVRNKIEEQDMKKIFGYYCFIFDQFISKEDSEYRQCLTSLVAQDT